ncbi:MAG: divalent-cation tolerance protein CutA [Candidatus Krumholzibacteriia bacterium]
MKSSGAAIVQVLVAVPSTRVATRIATALLKQRLCACAQTFGPITSRYHWKGKIDSAREWLLLLKTPPAHVEALEREVVRLHPYDVPEILALPVQGGYPPYLDWLRRETTRPRTGASAAGRGRGKRSASKGNPR